MSNPLKEIKLVDVSYDNLFRTFDYKINQRKNKNSN